MGLPVDCLWFVDFGFVALRLVVCTLFTCVDLRFCSCVFGFGWGLWPYLIAFVLVIVFAGFAGLSVASRWLCWL